MDAVSKFPVFLSLLPFGMILTMYMAISLFTLPMPVNLMITTRIAGITMESTVR